MKELRFDRKTWIVFAAVFFGGVALDAVFQIRFPAWKDYGVFVMILYSGLIAFAAYAVSRRAKREGRRPKELRPSSGRHKA